ncbi:MAG: hypothetical protein LC779_07265 [Actinobacteria bacterium]|nr:hypothetical protein [Actinomycetota bacterium]
MSVLQHDKTAPETWRPRAEVDILVDQLRAIDAWNGAQRSRRSGEDAAAAVARTREMRLDLSRRMDVVRRQHAALLERTAKQLDDSAHALRSGLAPRAVVVHRNDWFRDKIAVGLDARGITVVAQLENGADAVGVTVAEQPDLLLVEDKLPMLSGLDVIGQVLPFAPRTVVTAQAAAEDGIAALLDAGARTAWTRRVPPADVVHDLCQLVSA